ncbi:MAG: hypothetical protein HKL85_09330 [Acidimicrobiaceae bacterium]|nr:hypothetical protein [Acidimicrobiaceae bacterium]
MVKFLALRNILQTHLTFGPVRANNQQRADAMRVAYTPRTSDEAGPTSDHQLNCVGWETGLRAWGNLLVQFGVRA